MTAILTKQNAADKALVGGGDGMSNGGNGLLSNLHVFNGATFDGKTEFSNVDGASVTFNSTPVFENDIIVNVNQEPYKDGNPYTLTSILDVQDQLWTDKKILYKNVEIVDNTINACIDKLYELANTIDTHLTTNPDITETPTLMTENLPVLLNEPEEDEPVVDEPTVTINPNKINDTYDTVITAVSDTLTHFENNDLTLYNMTTDNSTKIDTINNAIKNINFDLGEKNKDIVEIFETLDQLQSDIDTNKINISTKASITELTNNYATNEKVDNLQLSLKALIDQIHTLDKSQESHLDANSNTETPNTYSMRRARVAAEVDDINDEKVNDVMVDWITTMNDSFNHFEENDKALKNNLESSISTINNKFDDYTTTADLSNKYALKTDSYTKTECNELLEPINENISLAASNIELLTGRLNLIQESDNVTQQILKHSLTLSNIEYDENLFNFSEAYGWYLYDDSDNKSSNFTYNAGTITLSDSWAMIRNHFLIFIWNNADTTQKYTIDVIVHEGTANVNGINISPFTTVTYSDGETAIDFPIFTNSIFALTIKNVTEVAIPDANVTWKIYASNTKKSGCLIKIYNRINAIKPGCGYYTDFECDGKFVKKEGNSTINGNLSINTTSGNGALNFSTTSNNGNNYQVVNILAPNLTNNSNIGITIGKSRSTNNSFHIYYREPGIAGLCIFGFPDIITFTTSAINLNKPTTISSNLTVNGKVTSNGSNTITHYCPIEAGEEISYYKIGKPVFMSGHVYKRVIDTQDENINPIWQSSTINDSTDCICSVIVDGSWKDFVGIITDVDSENGCIKFATHGDYLFYVDDANLYQIGDVLLYDGRILDEDYAMTLKIQQSIVGKVSGKINEHYLALFKA